MALFRRFLRHLLLFPLSMLLCAEGDGDDGDDNDDETEESESEEEDSEETDDIRNEEEEDSEETDDIRNEEEEDSEETDDIRNEEEEDSEETDDIRNEEEEDSEETDDIRNDEEDSEETDDIRNEEEDKSKEDESKEDKSKEDKNSDKTEEETHEVTHIKCRNEALEGQNHPETGVPFERVQINVDGKECDAVVPRFESSFNAQLEPELYQAKDAKQFEDCNRQLREEVEKNEELRSKFDEEQLDQIKNGETPDGFTWHHDAEVGRMQLVDSDIHAATGHTGGRNIWGGGTDNR